MNEHLHWTVNKRMKKQIGATRVNIEELGKDTVVIIRTVNSMYYLRKIDGDRFYIEGGTMQDGGTRYPVDTEIKNTEIKISGSTFGGSMIRIGVIETGMHLEIVELDPVKRITTSVIKHVEVIK